MKLSEENESLWMMIVSPLVWSAHFLLCYITAAIWCAKDARLPPSIELRMVLWSYTAIALALIVAFGWRALRQHAWGAAELPHDAPSAGDRHRFLGFATLLLCGLSFVAVVYSAMAIALVGSCR